MTGEQGRLATTTTTTPRGTRSTQPWGSGTRRSRLRNLALGGLLLAASLTIAALASSAQAASSVPLGTASNFAVLAGETVTNTGSTVIEKGDIGVFPGKAVTGFPPGQLSNGEIHRGDPLAAKAKLDLRSAYNDAEGQSTTEAVAGGDLTGRTLAPGVYSADSSLFLKGPLTLDARGDPDAVFIFKAGSSLLVSADSSVNLTGGARPGNVFWQVGSSATIGVNSLFVGNILALTSITLQTGAGLNGRALALNGEVTLDGIAGSIGTGSIGSLGGNNIAQISVRRALRYVALGDSYSSGEGLAEDDGPPYLRGGDPDCHRHALAYPVLFRFNGRRPKLDFFACSGARTEHIDLKQQRPREPAAPQALRPQVNKRTDLVTMTIGGNDVGKPDDKGNGGLSAPLTFCLIHSECQKNAKFVAELRSNIDKVGAKLRRTIGRVKARTGRNTAIFQLGYPRVFPTDSDPEQLKREQNCRSLNRVVSIGIGPIRRSKRVGWTAGEQTFLNGALDRLNDQSRSAADAAGIRFIDVTERFSGHAICDEGGKNWISPLGINLGLKPSLKTSSFHPNEEGHVAYRDALRDFIDGTISLIKAGAIPGRLTPSGLPANPAPLNRPLVKLIVGKTVRVGEESLFFAIIRDDFGVKEATLSFGDGTSKQVLDPTGGDFKLLTHRYRKAGGYTARLTVVSNEGTTTTVMRKLRVAPKRKRR